MAGAWVSSIISLPTFIAGLYRDCSQTALVLGKRFGHYRGYAGKGATPSGGQLMNVPIKSENIAAARALSRRVSLVTGSTRASFSPLLVRLQPADRKSSETAEHGITCKARASDTLK